MSRRRKAARRERADQPRIVVDLGGATKEVILRELTSAVHVCAAEPTPEPERDLEKLSVATLRALAGQRGIVLGRARTKAAIIEALRA